MERDKIKQSRSREWSASGCQRRVLAKCAERRTPIDARSRQLGCVAAASTDRGCRLLRRSRIRLVAAFGLFLLASPAPTSDDASTTHLTSIKLSSYILVRVDFLLLAPGGIPPDDPHPLQSATPDSHPGQFTKKRK
uniref:Uncharacterized protein n=1 Tax=Panagrellus redivivus TaxID=6233 RepID=A0A7E4UZ43_PANRE